MFDIDSYHKADSVDEAIARLVQNPNAMPLAGGTDILVRLHQRNPDYRHVVDIHDVAELKKIFLEPDGTIVVGSGSTFTDLTESRIISENIPVLAQGAGSVGGPQVRNQATVGGNICNGAPSADSAAPLLVLAAPVLGELAACDERPDVDLPRRRRGARRSRGGRAGVGRAHGEARLAGVPAVEVGGRNGEHGADVVEAVGDAVLGQHVLQPDVDVQQIADRIRKLPAKTLPTQLQPYFRLP